MPLLKCWTAEHRWSRHWHIALDTWWCVLEWKSCPRAIAPGCAAKLPLCHGCLYGSSEAIGELVYEVSWEIIMFIFMTADIHFSTGWVPQHHGAFQDQILFWLKSFAIDFSISFKEFCGELCEGSVRTDTQFRESHHPSIEWAWGRWNLSKYQRKKNQKYFSWFWLCKLYVYLNGEMYFSHIANFLFNDTMEIANLSFLLELEVLWMK